MAAASHGYTADGTLSETDILKIIVLFLGKEQIKIRLSAQHRLERFKHLEGKSQAWSDNSKGYIKALRITAAHAVQAI
jgi:hypothetical protein